MIILENEVFDIVKDPYTFYVLTASIARRASFDNAQSCFPSIQTICSDTGFSKNRVLDSLKNLEQLNLLTITKNKSKNGYRYNTYSLTTSFVKVVGNLKSEAELGSPDEPSLVRQKDLGSSPDEPSLVRQKDSNLKTNITSRPINPKKKIVKENLSLVKEVMEYYNQRHHKNTKSSVSWANNLSFWLTVYTLEEIKQAINNLSRSDWWQHDCHSLELLFRRKNRSGDCDYISQLLALPSNGENDELIKCYDSDPRSVVEVDMEEIRKQYATRPNLYVVDI